MVKLHDSVPLSGGRAAPLYSSIARNTKVVQAAAGKSHLSYPAKLTKLSYPAKICTNTKEVESAASTTMSENHTSYIHQTFRQCCQGSSSSVGNPACLWIWKVGGWLFSTAEQCSYKKRCLQRFPSNPIHFVYTEAVSSSMWQSVLW